LRPEIQIETSYRGDITTLTLQRTNVVLRPTSKGGEREPDYRIVQETEAGTVELGAAWKRRSEGGRDFLSVVLDDPALPTFVNVAMFMADHEDTAMLVWQRPAKKAATAETRLIKLAPRPHRIGPVSYEVQFRGRRRRRSATTALTSVKRTNYALRNA
jgi:uncharacterized protein (DUF736 family)